MKIFLTVGTHAQQFDRLIKGMDEMAKQNKKIKIIGQIGNSHYKPKNFAFKDFIQEPDYTKKCAEADVIVSHGGAGAIIHAMEAKKKLVIAPRLKKFAEHTNDHQLELAELLEKHRKAIAVSDVKELKKALEETKKFNPDFNSTRKQLIAGIEKWFNQL